MPANYYITEPSPSTTSYIRSGRGGAGNTFRAPPTSTTHRVSNNTSTSTTSPTAQQASSSSRRFFSGIGGAGNAHKASERPPLSLDDEVRRLAARDAAAQTGHCGIGGAGNVYRKASDAGSNNSSGEESVFDDGRSSVSSVGSRAKLWARMTGKEY